MMASEGITATTSATSTVDQEETAEELNLNEMGLIKADGTNWDRIRVPKKTGTLIRLEKILKENLYPDVVIEIENKRFSCHMIALQAYSRFFYNLGKVKTVTLPADKVTPAAFALIYDWILTDNARVKRQHLVEVFIAAKFLKIDELIEQCYGCFDSEKHFTEDTAFALYLECRNYGERTIQQLMIKRISKFFLTIVTCREFLELDANEVIEFLSSNIIGVHSESEVLFTAIRWLFYDWENRKEYLLDVLKCVRFGLTSPWLLFHLKGRSDVYEFKEIMKDIEVCKIIKDGIEYMLARFFHKESIQIDELMERVTLNEPSPRMWIKDTELEGTGMVVNFWLSDYDVFLKYLRFLQERGTNYWKTLQFIQQPEDPEIQNDRSLHAALENLSQALLSKIKLSEGCIDETTAMNEKTSNEK